MRRPITQKHIVAPDPQYNSAKVARFVNYVMHEGKKQGALSIVYDMFDQIKREKDQDPLQVFENALNNVGPLMELRSRRVGGANYQIPREVSPARRLALAFRWIIEAAREKKGSSMSKRLAEEVLAAANGEGKAVNKREQVHKMAEANRAFAYLAW